MIAKPNVVFVDVDDTFVRHYGSKTIPMPMTIKHIRELYEKGYELYCWSQAGRDRAKEMARFCGIYDCFIEFLPKPHYLIDDQPIKDWPLKEVLPNGSL